MANAHGYPTEFMKRSISVYNGMKERFGDQFFKHGKRKGQLRKAGRSIPFTLEQFRAWLHGQLDWMELLGEKERPKCEYCEVEVTIQNCGIDHVESVSRGGSLGLENLSARICQRCNQRKGELSRVAFKALYDFVRQLPEADRLNILNRLEISVSLARKDSQNTVRTRVLYTKLKQLQGQPPGGKTQ